MKLTLISLALTLALLPACMGTISPDDNVATFTLTTQPHFDPLLGLFAKECVEQYGGPEHCTPYPNDFECDALTVVVKGDGRTHAKFTAGGKLIRQGYLGLGEGVPFSCRAGQGSSCHVCVDMYGNAALDTCNRGTQTWRTYGAQQAKAAGFLEELAPGQSPTVVAPTTPSVTPPPTDACDPSRAVELYAKELNEVLKRDGLTLSWKPDPALFAQTTQFNKIITANPLPCPNPQPGGACSYCIAAGGSKKTCFCQRIASNSRVASQALIPASCANHAAWAAAIDAAAAAAVQWLFSPSYGAFFGKVEIPPSEVAQFPTCVYSPLVLDLDGDGITPTSNARGVRFDLFGAGAVKTAWVQGDDALLALDRDGNGRIDSGRELFGEGTPGGFADGFRALASLDSNRDGVVDGRDARFSELRLWNDRNRDGVSQPGELSTLPTRGVRSLPLGSSLSPAAVDRFGNDLRLQGSFTRSDGSSGLMVDVYFAGR